MSNHRRGHQSLRITSAVKIIILVSAAIFVSLGFVHQSNSVKQLGNDLIVLESKRKEMEVRSRTLRTNVARIKSPEMLRRRILEMGIELSEIEQGQIVRLYDAPESQRKRVANMAKMERVTR